MTRSRSPSATAPCTKSSASARPSRSIARSRWPKAGSTPCRASRASAGSIRLAARLVARDQRPAAGSAAGKALLERRPQQMRRAGLGRRVEHRASRAGPRRRATSGRAGSRQSATVCAGSGAREAPAGEIGARARARHAARRQRDPERQRAAVGPHHPALAARKVHEREAAVGPARSGCRARRSHRDRPWRCDCRTAAGDCRCRSPGRGCDRNRSGSGRRPAAPPRTAPPAALQGQPDRRGKAGETGPDDVHPRHCDQSRPWRIAIHRRSALPRRTGGSSCCQSSRDQPLERAAVDAAHDQRRAHIAGGPPGRASDRRHRSARRRAPPAPGRPPAGPDRAARAPDRRSRCRGASSSSRGR